jgi:hypothetical protein
MFGGPIYDHSHGRLDQVRHQLSRKQHFIARRRCSVYVETSHSFLKSYYDLALEYFPNSRFVHQVRDPLKTARSETNREQWIDSIYFPWRKYRAADGRHLFRWSLTGDEPIYQAVELPKRTLFQHYVIQWIEVENRAMQFLDQFDMHDSCATMISPRDLNDPAAVRRMIERLGLEMAHDEVQISGKQNRTPGKKTTVTSQEEKEFRQVIDGLPESYLKVFERAPYARCDWVEWLRK